MSEWKEVRLGDISTMKYGKLPPKNNIGEIPIYSGYTTIFVYLFIFIIDIF